ncbi:hypothetical protein ACN28C_25035 [Plantactinospora sp. WMMC1484]|uniref:hypothetical protein n=1 Tax=Plantactinospora sp. WMMC1484 TaxID=3404122 RepID=UPI003BF502C3
MPEQTVTFSAYRRPALVAGDYQITVSQTVDRESGDFTSSYRFGIGAERVALPPAAIRYVFPPDGSLGDHSNTLPHLVLDRPTLPWERQTGGGAADGGQPPWLALLLFTEEERPAPRTITLADLRNDDALPSGQPAPERYESDDDPVTVIDVPVPLLTESLPAYRDLHLLAHVRRGSGSDDDPATETAVLVGCRLPAAGATSTVHLVSLEGRYLPGGAFHLPHPGRGVTTVPTVPLVSLASWRFACVSDAHSFPALVHRLADDGGTLRLPESGEPEADRYLRDGYVPVRHRQRQGGQGVGWYRGPLTAGPRDPGPVPPRRTPDGLLRFDPELGMFDLGPAAAWQLGRLLALAAADVGTGLNSWRRRSRRARQPVDPDYPLAVPPVDDTLPENLLDWLRGLTRLDGVPLRYLLPDARLLPVESIRFLGLDQGWVRHLVDGAYSVGRLGPADVERDAATPLPLDFPEVTGALIRSEVIGGYPGLLVDGYDDADGRNPLHPWRVDRLTPDILLCLFAGKLARLDLHQPPEHQHLAVELEIDDPATGPTVRKTLRAPGGSGGGTPPPVGPLPLGARRTVPVRALADAMARALDRTAGSLDSGDFALQLTETAERVSFLR